MLIHGIGRRIIRMDMRSKKNIVVKDMKIVVAMRLRFFA